MFFNGPLSPLSASHMCSNGRSFTGRGDLPDTIPPKKTGSSRSHHLLMAPQLGFWPWERSYQGWNLGWQSHAGIVRISTDAVNSWAQWPCHVQRTAVTALPSILWRLYHFCLLFCQRSFFTPFNNGFPKVLHDFFLLLLYLDILVWNLPFCPLNAVSDEWLLIYDLCVLILFLLKY